MVKIKSYSNGEEYSSYGLDKGQEIIPKLREFLKAMGDKWPDKQFIEYSEELGPQGDEKIKDVWDETRIFEYKDCKVFLFFGMHNMYITLVYDKKNKEKIINKFMKIFTPELTDQSNN